MFIIAFSVVSAESYDAVRSKWSNEVAEEKVKELREGRSTLAKKVLVGTKVDYRDDREYVEKMKKQRLRPVTYQQGQRLANEIGAFVYVECSARTQVGVRRVFEEVVNARKYDEPPPVAMDFSFAFATRGPPALYVDMPAMFYFKVS